MINQIMHEKEPGPADSDFGGVDRRSPDLPALAGWFDESYCQWAGIQTLRPFEVPQVPSTQIESCEGGSPR